MRVRQNMMILPAATWRRATRSSKLLGRRDRSAVLELDSGGLPGSAGRTAAQRIDGHPKLVARLDAFARPSFADQEARRTTFEIPIHRDAVVALHIKKNIDVGARIPEIGHGADNLDRVLL